MEKAMTRASKPTVFVVDDDAAVRESIAMLVRSIGTAAEAFPTAADFLRGCSQDRPGCLVLDVRMPEMSGLQLQEKLTEAGCLLPVIFVTAHGDVPIAVQAMRAGAFDFIQKPFRDQDLLEKVQRAIGLDRQRRQDAHHRSALVDRIASLTKREAEVLDRVVTGKANKVIAAELRISQRTVEVHRAHIMEKLKADSVSDLVRTVLTAQGPG
jgi:two-component system, LuxR family, response regulator FixJ